MDFNEMEIIHVDLKYCERCGGLWLRRRGAEEVYCFSCCAETAEFSGLLKPRKKLPSATSTASGHAGMAAEMIAKFFGEGGNA